MQWRGRRGSGNIEDRRGMGGMGGMGGLGGKTIVGGGLGGVGLIVVLLITLLGGNPGDLLSGVTTGTDTSAPYTESAQDQELSEFVSVVLADTEEIWSRIFQENGMVYEKPTLVLYSGSVQSACGAAGASAGPFYCPGDRKLYIDLSFYDELQTKFQAPGDFAMAYVIAHEVGHHVQTLLGTSEKLAEVRRNSDEKTFNRYQVRFELQADYLAGVWAHHAEGMDVVEEGDLEEALNAASAVGDDTIQKRARGYAVPDSFTHGTSEQRKSWFYKGYRNGTIEGGDTFASSNP